MERIKITILLLFLAIASFGQSAKEVLDKTAATVSGKSGVSAAFTIKGKNMNASGTIAVKGRKFHATTPQATIWFDGKTMWTYMKQNEEVNVSNPSEAELAAINPYNFIYLYKNGYTYTLEKTGKSYVVHLKATDKKKTIQEMYITVSQKGYVPSQIRIKQKEWSTIDISNFKKTTIADAKFRFNSKDFPSAEIIDLR